MKNGKYTILPHEKKDYPIRNNNDYPQLHKRSFVQKAWEKHYLENGGRKKSMIKKN
jgi:hypothetical protein